MPFYAKEFYDKMKEVAMAATPGRIGDRIDGSGTIKYECFGHDGSVVLKTDHKNYEYGFVGDNAEANELFFRLFSPELVLNLLAELDRYKTQSENFYQLTGLMQIALKSSVKFDIDKQQFKG